MSTAPRQRLVERAGGLAPLDPSRRWIAAGMGGAVGALVAYDTFNSGGSTSLCDKSKNQDATSLGTCLGLYALGGLAGVGLGLVVVGFVTSDVVPDGPERSVRVGLQFVLKP